jgi:hypothetical protein
MVMVTAYTTALPPSALPAMESVLVAAGSSLLFALLLATLVVVLGVIVQGALARPPRRRPALRVVDAPTAGGSARHAA